MGKPKKVIKAKPLKWKICTEGLTEMNYFKAYAKTLGIEDGIEFCRSHEFAKKGCGRKHESLLNKIQECTRVGQYEKIFLVHDYDDAEEDKKARASFNITFVRARKDFSKDEPVHVVYSNPCFEYWLMLHVNYYDSNLNRFTYQKMVKDFCVKKREELELPIPRDYDYKSDPGLFTYFGGLEGAKTARSFALQRFGAEKAKPSGNFIFSTTTYAAQAPCTNIFELLDDLDSRKKS